VLANFVRIFFVLRHNVTTHEYAVMLFKYACLICTAFIVCMNINIELFKFYSMY
jgi:hypothetical protein